MQDSLADAVQPGRGGSVWRAVQLTLNPCVEQQDVEGCPNPKCPLINIRGVDGREGSLGGGVVNGENYVILDVVHIQIGHNYIR